MRRTWIRIACAALLVAGLSVECLAQNAPANPAPVNPAHAKLSRAAQRTLSQYRRRVGRQLRGGADDFYIVVTGEVTDTPREPSLLDSLISVAPAFTLFWDALMLPVVISSNGGAADLLITDNLPEPGPRFERKYTQQVHIVQGKLAAIQLVFDHTTEFVGKLPEPNVRRFRGWSHAGTQRTKEGAQARKEEVEKLIVGAQGVNPLDAVNQLRKLFGGKPAADPPEEGEKPADPPAKGKAAGKQ
jgi:hypothetical protein